MPSDLELVDAATNPLAGSALHDYTEKRRSEGPVVPIRFLGQPAWLITTQDSLARAFRDGDTFPPHTAYQIGIEPATGPNFQSMEGAEHHLYRKLATPAFRSRAVDRYEREGMAALVHELVDQIQGPEADLTRALTHRYPFLVISRLLGIPRDAEDQFHRWAVELLSFPTNPKASRAASKALSDYLAPVLEQRRRRPQNDVISALLEGEVEGQRLTDDEIYSHVKLIFAAGATTTHDALGNLLYALLTTEGAWERVVEEPESRDGAIDELLRWESPVALLPRISAPHAVEWDGTTIAGNTWVLFGIAAANRDPDTFADPDRYDIDRNTDAKLTFGPGPRSCPGMHLARKELLLALDVLTERMPELRLRDEVAARPSGAIIRGPKALPVAF